MARGGPAWRDGGLHDAAVVAGVVLLIAGLLFGRADVALLGVPALLATVLGRTRPPGERLTLAEEAAVGEAAGVIESTVQVRGGELVHARASAAGHRPTEFVARTAGEGGRSFRLRLASVRTGPQETAVVDVRAYEGVWEHDPLAVGGARRLVLPSSMRLGGVPVPRSLRGVTGPRVSRRFGDGNELRDVHPFQPGDRLRRIDWRATARRSPDLATLYVRRTFADAEAAVMLVVDSRDDVGPDVRTWRGYSEQRVDEATSLDLARHAAASVARALVEHGDRVGLIDMARESRPVPPATGRRHLRRVLHGLALAHPVGQPSARVRPPQVPGDTLVYLFSTVLDDAAAQLVRTWRSLGHQVVVVDTLPDVRPVTEPHLAIAWRIVRMERQMRLDRLAREGVPIVSWAGSGRLRSAASLEALARVAARKRDWR
ncbi:MAG: DUF58 domain-containing protein [Propionicimonas sp.]|uniref:DUF58 domain-containing protein n=1 Tax=Propionicimonas sp. TaxID=1955623 RepID=UPI003D1396B1